MIYIFLALAWKFYNKKINLFSATQLELYIIQTQLQTRLHHKMAHLHHKQDLESVFQIAPDSHVDLASPRVANWMVISFRA